MTDVVRYRAILALGSNQGARAATLYSAIEQIDNLPGTTVMAVSPFVTTTALTTDGFDETAPAFLNCVIRIETTLRPLRLLGGINAIEAAHGRVRQEKWGDRTLDIDIITIDGVTVTTPELTVPHPSAHERLFVLEPWLAIDSTATLPGHGKVADLVAVLSSV